MFVDLRITPPADAKPLYVSVRVSACCLSSFCSLRFLFALFALFLVVCFMFSLLDVLVFFCLVCWCFAHLFAVLSSEYQVGDRLKIEYKKTENQGVVLIVCRFYVR